MFCARAAASSGSSSSFFHRLISAVDAARREPLGVEVEVADHVAGEAHGVGLVVDRELAGVAEAVGVGAQDPHARRVERAHPHRAGDRADERGDALAHLVGRLVGERDGEDRATGARPRAMRWAMRCVSTRVLPEPAPATTSSGPPRWTTASSWSGFSPSIGGSVAAGAWPASDASGMSAPILRRGCAPDREPPSADDGDRAVGVGEHLEGRRAEDQLDEPRATAGADDDEVGVS